MEFLEIQNFLTIRHAKLDVRRFTIVIGPQANGKSVVAKLLYFFREFLTKFYTDSIENQTTKSQMDIEAILYFERIFPRYAWASQEFKLLYSIGDISISLIQQGRSSRKSRLKLDYSQNLIALHRKMKNDYKRRLDKIESIENTYASIERSLVSLKVLSWHIYDSPVGHNFQDSIFIPAGRSFFANLQKNVFSFLANNISIDPLIKEFGLVYESSKIRYDRQIKDPASVAREEIKQEVEKILAGQYVYEDDQDWIVSGKRRTNLANASSGQQEILPLFVVLNARLYFRQSGARSLTFFIEEPEAHLFPVSQRRLIGILSRL